MHECMANSASSLREASPDVVRGGVCCVKELPWNVCYGIGGSCKSQSKSQNLRVGVLSQEEGQEACDQSQS